MYKKGDVATVLLFVFAIALSVITLLVFASYSNNISLNSQNLASLSSQIEFTQNYIESNIKFTMSKTISSAPTDKVENFSKRIDSENLVYSGTENFLGKVKRKEFSIEESNGNQVFKMSDLKITAVKGDNKIERTISFCMEFDAAGKFVKNCESLKK